MAALSSAGDNANSKSAGGSTFIASSSKRHEEAVGRGLSYSVQHGHDVANTKFKASFLAETAAAAADIPLHVLTENCKDAVSQLQEVYPALQSLGNRIFMQDTNNDKTRITAAVKQTLLYVGTILAEHCNSYSDGDPAGAVLPLCLHVLEYLLRKFDIHRNDSTKYDLLWSLLMLSPGSSTTMTTNKEFLHSLLHRCLVITDWAAADSPSSQSYLWLRPYAAAHVKESSSTTTNLPPRSLIAVKTMKHVDILRQVCEVSRRLADIHNLDVQYGSSSSDSSFPRRGIGQCLSYTAAVLTEGLAHLAKKQTTDDVDGEKEAVLRTLLPTVLVAVSSNQSNNADFLAWGYILASAIAETMPLAPFTTQLLTTKILNGCSCCEDTNDDDDALQQAQGDTIACVLSILLPRGQQALSSSSHDYYLPLLNGKLLGCPLPEGTFKVLAKNKHLAAVLGHLYGDRRIVVAPLVAQLLVTAMQHNHIKLVLSLLQEDSLTPLYTNDPRTDLVASLAAWIVTKLCCVEQRRQEQQQQQSFSVKQARKVLRVLHDNLDAAACERGIAFALQQASNDNQMQNDEEEKEFTEWAQKLLRGIVSMANIQNGTEGDKKNTSDAAASTNLLLPPRIALEHADATIRLQAVQRLRCADIDDQVLESLLRHWAMDPDSAVALAACNAVNKCLEKWEIAVLHTENAKRVGELSIAGCYRWVVVSSQSGSQTNDPELVTPSLAAAAYVARGIGQLGRADLMELWQKNVEVLVAHLSSCRQSGHNNKAIAKQAAKALLLAFDRAPEKTKDASTTADAAKKLLLDSESFLKGLRDLYSDKATSSRELSKKTTELSLRQRCIILVLEAILEQQRANSNNDDLADDALALCLLVVGSGEGGLSPDFTSSERGVVKTCLEKSLRSLSSSDRVPDILITLASTESIKMSTAIAEPSIRFLASNVKDQNGNAVSPFTVLSEVSLRPNVDVRAVKRLLAQATKLAAKDDCTGAWLAIVPVLSLLEHSDEEVRDAAVDFLSEIGSSLPEPSTGRKKSLDWSCLREICRRISNMKASAKVGGESFLSNFLATCSKESPDSSKLQQVLLSLCLFSVVCCGNESVNDIANAVENAWLPVAAALGGCRAAAVLLHATELAGEEAFSLSNRWAIAGQPLLEAIIAAESMNDSPGLSSLVNCIGRMIKGVTVSDPRVIISFGPRGGRGRVRSYSVGKMDGISFLTPYPDEMRVALVEVLSKCQENIGTRLLSTAIVRDVLESKSWGEGVFKTLSPDGRKDIISAVLKYIDSGVSQASDDLLGDLPLVAGDIIELIGSVSSSDEAILIEFVSGNAERLALSLDISTLISLLFGRLAFFSSSQNDNDDCDNYLLHSVLCALVKLLECTASNANALNVDRKRLDKWAKVILELLGNSSSQSPVQKLPAHRSRMAALSLLVGLCSHFPKQIVSTLIPATLSAVAVLDAGALPARRTFSKTIPAFIKHSAAGRLSLTHLLGAFSASLVGVPKQSTKERLLHDLADALIGDLTVDSHRG